MPQITLKEPVELTDIELDTVSAGVSQTGLVNINDVRVDVSNILKHNNVEVAVAANVIGQGARAQA